MGRRDVCKEQHKAGVQEPLGTLCGAAPQPTDTLKNTTGSQRRCACWGQLGKEAAGKEAAGIWPARRGESTPLLALAGALGRCCGCCVGKLCCGRRARAEAQRSLRIILQCFRIEMKVDQTGHLAVEK